MTREILAILIALPLLASCSGNYSFDSDISTENTKQYFSASKVNIFQSEQQINAPHQLLGLVEGEDCQTKAHLAAPDIINARTQARQLAFKQGANGVVFTSCVDIETKHCIAQVVCYAKAYQIETTLPEKGNNHTDISNE